LIATRGEVIQQKSKTAGWQQKYSAAARALKQENDRNSQLNRTVDVLKGDIQGLTMYLTQFRQLREAVQVSTVQ
jgi:hypothetical protein